MNFTKHIVLVIFYLSIGFAFGQEQENNYKALKFKNLSLNEGLSQSSVLCILQDKKGFLWFGTRDGLNKYDGNEFKIFRHNSQDSTSLSHNFIRTLYQDTNGNIWVGTVDGLNKYIPETNSFERYGVNAEKNGADNLGIWSITEDNTGNLWLGTSLGLKKVNPITGKFIEYTYPESGKEIFNTSVRAILMEDNHKLWIKTTEHIGVYDIKTNEVKQYSYPENSAIELNKNNVSVLYQDKQKDIWLGFKNGLAKLNREHDVFEFFKINEDHNNVPIDDIRSLCEDYLGNLWVGTYNGLYIVDASKRSISHFVHDENNPNSLSQNSIYKIYEDSKGDIWIGTYAGGISYYDRSYDVFKHFSAGTNNTKLNYKVVSSILEDSNSNLWIGTEGGGINYFNKRTGVFKYYTNNPKDKNSLSTNNVKAMIQDHAGNFWIGTHDGGLNFLNPNEYPYRFKKLTNDHDDTNSISNNRVIALFEDYQYNIWIGTGGGGLNVLYNETNSITQIVDPQGFLGDLIYIISETSEKKHLLIGGSNGLAKINLETNQLSSINYLSKYNKSKTSDAVLSVYEDGNKNLWIGTEGDGLYCYNMSTQKTTKFDITNGLPNDVIYGIVPDSNNNIWLSTNYGLSRINLQSFQIKNFNASDGLQSNEFNYGAYLKNKKGELLFGGANGFNVFNPNDIAENAFVPPVTITSFKVNNKPYLNVTDSTDLITLRHKQNVFNFDFVALSYSQPNKNQYAYKLEGFDLEWNYIGNKKSATYTNLDDGDYVFKVKASNNDGLWNEKGASIAITILPAPWQTWWAYLLYFIILTVIALLVAKYSLIRIRERNELKLERLDKERIKEVNQMKLRLFTNISHDFRTPLTLIIGPLERMLRKKNGNDFIQKQHEIMHRNASVLLQLINQLLDFRKSESGKLQLSASQNNIVPFIENIKLSFEELARIRQINYTFKTSNEEMMVWFDKINLKKIVFNLLSNAFKFTPDSGNISISLSTVSKKRKIGKPSDYFKLEIKDSGKGIPKEKIEYVFDRFYQLGQDENTRSGTGIGLALTKNLVELHKGVIKVKSTEGNGASFSVLLPLGKHHLSEDQIILEAEGTEGDNSFYSDKPNYLIKELLTNELDEESEMDESRPTLLLVEDNPEVRSFIKGIFQTNHNILEAENGQIALEIAKNNTVDLIISDVMMPVMDGIEFCEKIKTNILTSHIPVLLLTAKTSEDAQKTGFTTGADAYLTKPFDANILELRVRNILNSRRSLIEKFKKDIILEPKELTATSADELFLNKAITLIEDNMTNSKYTINDFIQEMSMSRSALYRKLKVLTDQSISEFIRTIKLKRAGQLISKSQLSISEIAYDLGFNDLKHFRKSFQKLFNQLPSEYRANSKEE